MRQVVGLVLLGLMFSNAVLAEDATSDEGVSHSGRIINGNKVNIAQYKHALSLWIDGRYTCGASIITRLHALTAAHCVNTIVDSPTRALLYGATTYLDQPIYRIKVRRISVHPSYNPLAASRDYDVAVLRAPKKAFVGKPNMAPIELQETAVSAGTNCYAVGWGWYDNSIALPSKQLRHTNLKIESDSSCSEIFRKPITPDQICSLNGSNMEVCKGDSGSALVCGGKLTGIVSHGRIPCTSAAPTIYAKVVGPSIRSFIRSAAGI
ncbi:trypsin 3A1-like [Anopheles stephensi]|uniref:trypsin 3A1-like n=1 Tax=Anopheles stephensi TaxID=30069 RepID=UPI0016588166|nr:trypsin 3A1-like [Anopheles stephensi]